MTFLFCAARRRQWLPVAAAVLVIWMAGCSAEATPEASGSTNGSVSASASETSIPTATPKYKPADAKGRAENVPVPVLPEAAKAETKEGLLAFGRYWFDQLNYAYQTGDVSGVQGLSSGECQYCQNLISSISSSYASNRWLVGGRIDTPSVETNFKIDNDGFYQIFVQVQQTHLSYFEHGNKYGRDTSPSDTGVVMLISYREDAWHLNSMHPLR